MGDMRESEDSAVTFSRVVPQGHGEVRGQVQSCCMSSGSAGADQSRGQRPKLWVTGVREHGMRRSQEWGQEVFSHFQEKTVLGAAMMSLRASPATGQGLN